MILSAVVATQSDLGSLYGGATMLPKKHRSAFQIISAMVLLIFTMLLVGNYAAAQSESEKELIKTFTKTVNDVVPANIDQHYRHVVKKVPCGWLKMYYESNADYSIDVRKTDSIVSPYLGVAQFHVE